MEEQKKSVFETLNAVNVNEHTEKKNNLTYLSWAWAWAEVKKRFPSAFYTIYENEAGWCYHTDGRTCWVKTGVTIEGLEHIEYLPVMDYKNASIPAERVTSFDVNKAIQRSLTKAVARHGLGLYVYAGEDLPELENSVALASNKARDFLDGRETPVKEPINPELLKEAETLGIELEKVATYLRKTVDDLTNDDLRACIGAKKQAIAKKAGAAK